MEDSDSTTSTIRSCDYFSLLQAIDKLSNLATDGNSTSHVSRKSWDISVIEAIFDGLTANIQRMRNLAESESNEANFKKNAMFCISILNTIIRVFVMDGFSYIISRQPFQSMFEELKAASECYVFSLTNEFVTLPILASDIVNSMLLNLSTDDLIETCFKRLLSKDTPSDKGKILFSFCC